MLQIINALGADLETRVGVVTPHHKTLHPDCRGTYKIKK